LVALFIATVATGTPLGICIIIKEKKKFRTFCLTIEKKKKGK
jgi:hypothetical protein